MLISMFDPTSLSHWLLRRQRCDGGIIVVLSSTVPLYRASQLWSADSTSSSKRPSRSDGSSDWEAWGRGLGEMTLVPLCVGILDGSESMFVSLSIISILIEMSSEIFGGGGTQSSCDADSVCFSTSSWRDGEGGHCDCRGVGSRESRPFIGRMR